MVAPVKKASGEVLPKMKIAAMVAGLATRQDYAPAAMIRGVKLVELRRFTGEDGSFKEVVRIEKGRLVAPADLAGFEVKQINHGRVVGQTIKAWHYHLNQDEIWFIHPEVNAIVGLLDIRENSQSLKKTFRLALGDGRAHLLSIPRGVAHGLSNPYTREVTMTYLVSNYFDGTDEWRLPFDFGVEKNFWGIKRG